MPPATRSRSKDKKASKEPQKASKSPVHANAGGGVPASGYNPLLGTFHTLDPLPVSSASSTHVNGRSRNMDDIDDHNGISVGTGLEYDSVSNNGSWSGESEDPKEKISQPASRSEPIPGADNDKREKIRQKNEKKHQRQKERRAQELHERCSGYLMSRKLEALAQQLVAMGFSSERATMALILNEGRVEESVAWLFEGGEEVDNHKEHNLDSGGNLKIDIADELARIADMESRYKCSKQEVERAIVVCEGDLEKAEDTLKVQKQDPPSAPQKPEETGDPPTVSNDKISVAASQNSTRILQKPVPSISMQQKMDERDFNYTKAPVTVGTQVDPGSKNVQSSKRILPKLEWAKHPQIASPTEKRWPSAGSNPSGPYHMASSLQVSPPPTKTEARYVAVGNELKNLKLGSVTEPVAVMQRPQPINIKQASSTSMRSSPPGTAASWHSITVETMKPSGLVPQIPSSRSLLPSHTKTDQLHNQFQYQQKPQFVSSSGSVDSLGTNQGNGLWNGGGTSPCVAAATSLGLFSGLGSNGACGLSSPVDWNSGGSMLQFDYTNIDWSLDRGSSAMRPNGRWQDMSSYVQKGTGSGTGPGMYDSYPSGSSANNIPMRPVLPNGSGHLTRVGLRDGVSIAETSAAAAASREWASPFEEKDLFSLPRQFVSSPSL